MISAAASGSSARGDNKVGRGGRGSVLAVLVVLACAALPRFAVLDYGLPEQRMHGDERLSKLRARNLTRLGRTTDWRWPNANTYLSVAALQATHRLGRAVGSDRLAGLHPFVVGRAWTALCGVLTVWLVYLLGARLFDRSTGLAAAAILAATPLHAHYSRLWLTDAPMTLAYTLAVLLAVRVFARPSLGRLALAGAAIGLATATKYNGASACFAVVLAALLAWPKLPEPRRLLRLSAGLSLAALVSVAVFFACDPFILLAPASFLADLDHAVTLYTGEPETGLLGWHVLRYVTFSLFESDLGPVLGLLALLGGGLLLGRRRPAGVLVVVPAVLYLLAYSSSLRIIRMGNFLPVLPHAALAAGFAAIWLTRRVAVLGPRIRLLLAPAAALILILAAWPATVQAVGRLGGDTRLAAKQWLHENVPPGAAVLTELNMVPLSSQRYRTPSKRLPFYFQSLDRMHAEYDYMVASSFQFAWIFGQRSRPGFGERAELYERLFSEPRFELAARFVPSLRLAGPEIRIYRTLPPRGLQLAAGPVRLRGPHRSGVYYFTRSSDRMGGALIATQPGRYELRVRAVAEKPFPLELSLGVERRRISVEGETEVAIAADLEPGQRWWGVAAAEGVGSGDHVRLCCMSVVLDAPGAARECLSRRPLFWGTHPRLSAAWLPLEVCGARLTTLDVDSCDSAIEALCSEGGQPASGASAALAKLTRLLTAAKLSQLASADSGGYCGSAIARRVSECEELCGAEPDVVRASGCLEDLRAFVAAADTFLSPPALFEQTPATETAACAAAQRNAVLPGFGVCSSTDRRGG